MVTARPSLCWRAPTATSMRKVGAWCLRQAWPWLSQAIEVFHGVVLVCQSMVSGVQQVQRWRWLFVHRLHCREHPGLLLFALTGRWMRPLFACMYIHKSGEKLHVALGVPQQNHTSRDGRFRKHGRSCHTCDNFWQLRTIFLRISWQVLKIFYMDEQWWKWSQPSSVEGLHCLNMKSWPWQCLQCPGGIYAQGFLRR